MNKILKPYTIVPSNLYVERSADRQVKNILEDMGRPGYVLVSRQMGKTNLLINARRKYANDNDRFVYLDLSNLFDNEIQCFRNIIDTAIETNLEAFSHLEIAIRDYRKVNSELPPHKQHEKELRMLLNSIKGKLIIILDEIDALTKVEYSERIFAQIRSIYFARTNYEEFNRLTYLLSGVVEPSELIKDPKISPFNIGEKIFLNDFTKVEFDAFMYKAELSGLDENIKNRIFYWTNGNPRLTWDLCCIIEDQKETIKSELVIDSLVKVHYLTSFDKPPIDNIREIVKKEPFIQDALIEIEYGKGDVISDDIKQKLYLAGIINYTESDIKIKNRIIKESLSSQWIDSIRKLDENLLDKGINLYNDGSYKKAIITLKTYLLQKNDITEKSDDFNISHFHLGLSYYYDNNFDDALTNLNKVNFDSKRYGNLFFKTELFKGYIFQNSKKYIDAQKAFEKIVSVGVNDEFYLYAKVNLGLVLSLNEKSDLEKQKSKELFLEIANSKIEEYNKIDNQLFIEARAQALFSLADNEKNINSENYINFLKEALSISPVEYKPAILFNLYIKEEDSLKQSEYLDLIANEIIENNLKPTKSFEFKKIKFTHKLLRQIQLECFKIGKIGTFQTLINYEKSINSRYNDDMAILDKLIGIAQELEYPTNLVYELTEYLYHKCDDNNLEIRKNALKLLSTLNLDPNHKYAFEYIKALDVDGHQIMDLTDLTILVSLIQISLNKKELKNVIELINSGERLKFKLSDNLKNSILIFDYLKMQYRSQIGQIHESKNLALHILNQVKTLEEDYLKNQLIRQIGIQNIVTHCQNILSKVRKNVPLQFPKKNGRNDLVKVKYKNGEEKTTKYKKVEFDINKGNCIIIN